MESRFPFDEPVGILGSGAAGLITAHTLIKDGFSNVTVLSKDVSPGGVWSARRVYDGLTINSVHGEFRFSPMPMPPPDNPSTGRLTGRDMCAYMEHFANKFLTDKVRYNTEVKKVYRPSGEKKGWLVDVHSLQGGSELTETLHFARLVLCTGGCHVPFIPPSLSPITARNEGFQGRVFHSSQFRSELDRLSHNGENVKSLGRVVIIGGGKSAQDISAYLATQGVPVSVVFERTDAFLASIFPLPHFIRKSRFLSILAGYKHLETRLERFLHTTWLGGIITSFTWKMIQRTSIDALHVSRDSPLNPSDSLFWTIRTNDEGAPRKNSFHDLANKGRINLVSPSRATSFGKDGRSILLNDGSSLECDTVVLATGYSSSWTMFDEQTSLELGLARHPPSSSAYALENRWNYTSFVDPPKAKSHIPQWTTSVYRGIVPAENLLKHDLAINGAVFTTNNGYSFEVVAHWISSYFLRDPHLRLPKTVDEALDSAEQDAAWIRRRHPGALLWVNPSYSSSIAFWTWPQAMDELLRDMGLKTGRSGGNWLSWPFKVISVDEISTLGEERRGR
ncbi:hypothetical protein GYMLUDRAFT_67862 [Collybiopsis luxurians FD-317 M1]|nr:hypothetical protein GYMLUDRAFT_67862 [Collybiopsis luxurians FD-317 M1]